MKLANKEFRAVAESAFDRARTAGTEAAHRAVEATDAALIEVGKAAQQRQRRRTAKAAFKVAGKAAVVAGTAVAAAMIVRAARARMAAK